MPDRILAEFPNEDAIVSAIERLRRDGFAKLEAYMPFPSHEVEAALGRRPSRLPWAIFLVGGSAAVGAYLLQWYLVGYLYPLVVGSRPPHFPLAFIIITFEMGILFSGFASFFGPLVLGRLFRLNDEVQNTPGFVSATRDSFWLEIRTSDPAYRDEDTRKLLTEAGATRVEVPEAYP
ncbi:MAG: DUF3341 domain-containing protein [Kofleriaceae bacterium]|nr:DUF3341 domain-containing protein [Kofleriaceae bacterium]